MPVSQHNYDHRGGGNRGIIICCPNIVGQRLVYFDHSASRRSWVIRDFITGQKLSNHTSQLMVDQIEADAMYDEFPPYHNVTNIDEWAIYLRLRTKAVFRLKYGPATTPPDPNSGTWQAM